MRKVTILFICIGLFGVESISGACTKESVSSATGTNAPPGPYCSGDLIFEDNFDKFDFHIWQHENTLEGGGNWEFEWYTNNRSNSYAEDGVLHIAPTFVADDSGDKWLYSATLDVNGGSLYEMCNDPKNRGCVRTGTATSIINPIKSARIRTIESFAFRYGKIEVSAKIPSGDWLWPAIWLMPKYNEYSTWPASGEIDIMESRGNPSFYDSNGVHIGKQQVSSTLILGPNMGYQRNSHWVRNNASGYDKDFHKYQLEWSPTYLRLLVDDVEHGTVTPPAGGFWEYGSLGSTGLSNPWRHSTNTVAPFDTDFFIILNLAVGGNSFPDANNTNGKKPWTSNSPTALKDFWEARGDWQPTWNLGTDDSHFKVDYVRVYAL